MHLPVSYARVRFNRKEVVKKANDVNLTPAAIDREKNRHCATR